MESVSPLAVVGSVGALIVVSKAYSFLSSFVKSQARKSKLTTRANEKRSARNRLREQLKQVIIAYLESRKNLTLDQCNKIAYMSAGELSDAMKSGELKVADVVAVFSARSLQASTLDIVAEEMYTTGLSHAQELDAAAPNAIVTSDPKCILYGVPVSIKDHINVEGMDSTCGLAVRCFQPATEDAVIVKLLRQAGAIPIVRGNVPQCLMLPESDCLIWGQAKNPWNVEKTPGGSSGGDAALVATRSVPISIGSDIGGSIRIPSHFCGIFGLKPTPGRISGVGCVPARPQNIDGQQIIKPTLGPMANCVEDLALVMKAVLVPEMSRLDPTTPYTGFDNAMYEGISVHPTDASMTSGSQKEPKPTKLKVGYFDYDGYIDVPIVGKRAVLAAVEALRENGHECVPFEPPSVEEATILYLSILGADGDMQGFFDGLEGESLHPMYLELKKVATLPNFLRPIVGAIFNFIGETRSAQLVKRVTSKDSYAHWNDIVAVLAYCKKFTEKWMAAGLDVVICPGFFTPAADHDASANTLPLVASCFLWNVLHYPVGAMPITNVRAGEDNLLATAQTKDRLTHFAHQAMQNSTGLPFGVQVAALPYRDEVCLRVMRELQYVLKNALHDENALISPFNHQMDQVLLTESQ